MCEHWGNHDKYCFDKYGRSISEGDTVRVKTCGSLEGEFLVTRMEGKGGGELFIGYPGYMLMLYGFYPGTLEVID